MRSEGHSSQVPQCILTRYMPERKQRQHQPLNGNASTLRQEASSVDEFAFAPAGQVLRALVDLGWEVVHANEIGNKSYSVLRRGDKDYIWAFDDGESLGPVALRRIAKHTGLAPENLPNANDGQISVTQERKSAEPAAIFSLELIDPSLYRSICAHPELLQTLHWRTFERLLADILDAFGYEVDLQRGTKDGGVDVFAVKRADPLGAQRFLLQAKRWKNAVGIEPVRELAFLHAHERVTKSCLVTTAKFTKGAWDLAEQYRWQLELRDFEGLLEWVRIAATLRGGH
jgi:HJR/Mrr/RecB family endonuclease